MRSLWRPFFLFIFLQFSTLPELDTLLLVAGGVPFRHEGQMELVFVGPAPPHGRNGGPGGGENNTSSSLPGRNSSEAAGVECPIGNMQVFPGFLQNAKLGFSNGIPLMCGGKKVKKRITFLHSNPDDFIKRLRIFLFFPLFLLL